MAAPETFEAPGEFSDKFDRLFSQYGTELLSILSNDPAIYQEKEVSGYGLNLSWRNIVPDPRGPRVTLERAIVYFPKDEVRSFLTRQLSRNDLLERAVIFSVREDAAPALVSFRPPEPRQDFRAPIHEESLAVANIAPAVKPAIPPQSTALREPAVSSPPEPAKGLPRTDLAPRPSPSIGDEKISRATPMPPQSVKDEPKQAPPLAAAAHEATDVSPPAVAEPKRSEPKPIEQAEIQVEAKLPKTLAQTDERSAAPVKTPVSDRPAAKPVERLEAKDSEQRLPVDVGATDVQKVEAPSALPHRAEPTEIATIPEAPEPPTREEEARQAPPVDTSLKLAEAPPATPPAAPVTQEPLPPAVQEAPVEPTPATPAAEPVTSPDSQEQLALLRRPPSEPAMERKPPVRALPRALEGFVIQVGFSERVKAQQWAESMERNGYAVSVTESAGGAIRVRVGNFAVRDEAEHRLQSFRKEGLTGIVINLPQAFRPQVAESKTNSSD